MTSRRRMLVGENLTSKGVSASGEILDDWEQIVKICNAGKAQNFYSEGNWKKFDYDGTESSQHAILLGFNKEIRADVPALANTTWFSTPSVSFTSSTFSSQLNSSNYANWTYGQIDETTVLGKFPAVIKDNIKDITKRLEALTQVKEKIWGGTVVKNCKLWALSECDVSNTSGGEIIYGNCIRNISNILYQYRTDHVMGQTQFNFALQNVDPGIYGNYSTPLTGFSKANIMWNSSGTLLWIDIDFFSPVDYKTTRPCFCI